MSKEGHGWHESHKQSKPNQPEQSPQGGSNKSPEHQPLPNVWDVLERKARASDAFRQGRMTREERERERHEVDRLKEEIDKKGKDRDKHLLALLFYPRPRLSWLSELEKVQQLRTQVEPLSDEEIAECAHKQKEEIEAFQRGEIPILSFHPSASDGELILAEYITKKDERS